VPAPGRLDARAFLSGLADAAAGFPVPATIPPAVDPVLLTLWLRHARLSAAAYPLARAAGHEELAGRLRVDALAAAAANLVRFRALGAIEDDFAARGIRSSFSRAPRSRGPPTGRRLLARRWPISISGFATRNMPAAIARVEALGYRRLPEVSGRPAELLRRSGGEVVFAGPGTGLLELHYSAFQGWWIRRNR
jgi:hypothetical protein